MRFSDTESEAWECPSSLSSELIFAAGLVCQLEERVKPFLKMPEEIEKYSTLQTGYRALYLNLHSIASKIKRKSKVTSEIQELFDAAQDQYKSLALNDVVNINGDILKRCQQQVNREIPVESLWYPPRQGE